MAARGTLIGIGVGPGAPDLITLRALDRLKSADVIAIPRSSKYSPSTAWSIVKPHMEGISGQERLFLTFPMSMDPERVRPAWQEAFIAIGSRLERGLSVAFITLGDPLLYSTFIYLLREAPRRWPGLDIEIVPGVTSVTAVPAVSGMALADGQERIAIVPAAYGVADLEATLDAFDTVVLMKIGPEMDTVVQTLERRGLVQKAVYVCRATMGGQTIVRDVREIRQQRGDCFAMMIIAKKSHSGVLLGDVAQRQISRASAEETAP
ncbi:MAG: precorrin-2 C(20)-methyltransferase [Proteobacteria bacterium]|nr:precorrin-2 C(20)-methyltransferase [Pseudomonadota bacterium]